MSVMDEIELRKNMPELPEQLWWIDGPVLERSFVYWWHGPLGTYKATHPHEFGHKRVGHQETLRITGRIHGLHPELGGAMGASESCEWTDLDLTRELPDVFYRSEPMDGESHGVV